jgi:hypothetical protein
MELMPQLQLKTYAISQLIHLWTTCGSESSSPRALPLSPVFDLSREHWISDGRESKFEWPQFRPTALFPKLSVTQLSMELDQSWYSQYW